MPDEGGALRILVAISGTERSVRAAEFAFTLAKASDGHCAMTFIDQRPKSVGISRVTDRGQARAIRSLRLTPLRLTTTSNPKSSFGKDRRRSWTSFA